MENQNEISPEKFNLDDYGFRTAGQTGCNPQNFRVYLASIVQGRLVDESIKIVLSKDEKEHLKNQQTTTKNNIISTETEIEKDILEIEQKKKTIENLRNEIENIKLGKHLEGEDKFSTLKFTINTFLLFALSVYLFLFYVAVIYKTFFTDNQPDGDVSQIGNLVDVFPQWGTIVAAFKTNLLIAVAPVIFFAFGYALHVMLDKKGKLKYFLVSLIIAATFTLDFLLALKGHQKQNEFKALMELPTEEWTKSTTFYIILFMGFIVYIVWSVLLSAFIHEWKKRDVLGKRVDLISEYEKLIADRTTKITGNRGAIRKLEQEILELEKRLTTVYIPVSDIKFCLSQFFIGWSRFGSGAKGLNEHTNQCEIIYNEFVKNIQKQ